MVLVDERYRRKREDDVEKEVRRLRWTRRIGSEDTA